MSITPTNPAGRAGWPTALPLVAILRGVRPDEVLAQAEALVDAGFDCIEVPTNSPDWALSVQRLAQAFGSRVLVGAGTVMDAGHLDALQAAGGQLVVTPHTDTALVQQAAQRGLRTAIGFTTPSEAFAALRAGAQVLKLFPASVLGPAHMAALRSVLPAGTPVLAVGGVTPANLAGYLAAGCIGAGLGSDLYKPGQAATTTAERAAAFVAAWRAAATPTS